MLSVMIARELGIKKNKMFDAAKNNKKCAY